MMRWSRRPFFHFIAIGAFLYAAKAAGPSALRPEAGDDGSIVVTAGRVLELRRDWLARTGREPDEREIAAAVRAEVDDELLIREARRLRMHSDDPVVVRRLLQNMQFLAGDPERSPEDLLAEAYALRMDRTDLVVRRRLVQKLQLQIFGAQRTPAPSDSELAAYVELHPEHFERPARARLYQLFLSRDRRGAALESDAAALLARLVRDGVEVAAAGGLGDPFLFPNDPSPRSERELAKLFGPEFAAAVMASPALRWSGPVASAYGLHLVWLHEHVPSAPAPLEAVRSAVREAIFAERGELALRDFLANLRAQTPVRVESPATFTDDAG